MFEGSEKKVELMVRRPGGLRALPDSFWHDVVRASGARILSSIRTDACSAHLLSESSLFVRDDSVTMITCGQTRLVDAIEHMLTQIPASQIELLIYERKDALYPELQATNFLQDGQRLSRLLPGNILRFGDEHARGVDIFFATQTKPHAVNHQKFEVLMHGIDAAVAAKFVFSAKPAAATLARALELDQLLPGYACDEHRFNPVGYSLNALRNDHYYTIHVTPERTESYVSFETNQPLAGDLHRVLNQLLSTFAPRSFDILLFGFTPGAAPDLKTYRLHEHQSLELGVYQATFWQYYRPPEGARPAQIFDLQTF